MEGPAQTSGYLIAGYALIFGMLLIYIGSLWIRKRRLRKALRSLEKTGSPFTTDDQ